MHNRLQKEEREKKNYTYMYNEDICRAELHSFSLNRIKPIYKGHKLLCFGALTESLADEQWQKSPLWVGYSIIVHCSASQAFL